MRYLFIPIIIALFTSCSNITLEEKALRIHDEVLTLDSHNDTPMRLTRSDFDLGERHSYEEHRSHVDLPRMKEGGLDGAFFAVFLGQRERNDSAYIKVQKYTERIFDSIHSMIEHNKQIAGLALNPSDAYAFEKAGKRSIFIGIENGYPIAEDLDMIDHYYDRGARYITLCHTKNNQICDSSTDEEEHDGLSSFGKDVVKRMNEVGMMIDVSHASDKSFYDILEISNAPIIASHSCARAICNNPRNLDDDMLKALAENGGVIQMCILSAYVKEPDPYPERDSAQQAVREKYKGFQNLTDEEMENARRDWYAIDKIFPRKLANVQDVVDHIDHMVEIAGIDHIGIGTDFDGGGGVEGCMEVNEMPNITKELVKRGYSELDVEKIWGGNLVRVMREVENASINN